MNEYPVCTVEQEGNIPQVVCKENGRVFHLTNKSNYYIQKIKVDNSLIRNGVKCDYAIDLCKAKTDNSAASIYLVELKGVDKSHACEQLLTTYSYFCQNNYKTDIFHCRIVLSKDSAPHLFSSNQKRLMQLEKQKKLDLDIKCRRCEEVI